MSKLNLERNKFIAVIIAFIITIIGGISFTVNLENGKWSANIEYKGEKLPVYITNDKGEIIEENNDEIPTVESIDGGLFKDKITGLSLDENMYADLGWSETYNTSTPQAFRDDTYGKCIYANNVYGAQCVSLARVFWWSYADRDVSTCGTGMAKGMMNCAEQNAGDEFEIFWGNDNIQAGDWLVFDGGMYGHVGMALGSVVNGYVALLGENQGGNPCNGGGSSTNIINMSIKNLIGGYRPKDYITNNQYEPDDNSVDYTYKKGDYFSKVLLNLGLDEGNLWGDNGSVKFYTEQLIEQNVLDKNGNVIIGKPFNLQVR